MKARFVNLDVANVPDGTALRVSGVGLAVSAAWSYDGRRRNLPCRYCDGPTKGRLCVVRNGSAEPAVAVCREHSAMAMSGATVLPLAAAVRTICDLLSGGQR